MVERASTATVVFTDLVGAAALRARLGEERADALWRVHDRIVRARLEAGSGQVLKTQGDGMVAAFPSASHALTAAVRVQQALVRYNSRPDAVAELSVRIGVSTGDVSWDGGDCFGTPMVEAARLMAAAEPGQILCSDFVRMMARGRGGHDFVDLGFLELKGLPEPLAACTLEWAPAPDRALPLPPELATGWHRPFVSRIAELQAAETVLGDQGRERTAVVWLLGEPGIGKTRLATEIACRAHAQGAVVLFGRCNEDLAIPYEPFLEALRFFVDHLPDEDLTERLGDAAGELVRLLPELGTRLPGHDTVPAGDPEGEHYRLFEAVRGWLAAAGGPRPVVLVVDDLHWAARPTLQLLGHVARSAAPSRLVVIGTARDTAPDDNESLAALLEDLERKAVPSHRLELEGLDVEDVGALVSSAAGRGLDDRLRKLAVELTAETSGNPLFVDALLDSLPADPAWRAGAIPRSLAETVRRRLVRLPARTRDVLAVASVAGLDFDLPLVARAAEQTELDALDALETAGRAGLVTETGADRYHFTHGLVRSALRDELSRSRRVRIHLAVAEAIEALHAAEIDEHSATLAYHFFEAAPAGGAARAYHYSLLAAARAERLLAFSEAAETYGRALDVVDRAGEDDPLARARLLLAQGTAQRLSSDFGAALGSLRAAADEARRLESAELLAEAAVAFEDAGFEPGFHGADAVELLEEAASALGPGADGLRALIAAGLARALEFSGRHGEAVAAADGALAMARRVADPAVIGNALHCAAFSRLGPGDATALTQIGEELLEIARQLDDVKLLYHGFWFRAYAAVRVGDLETADRCLEEFTGVLHRAPPGWKWEVLTFTTARALMAADLALAEQLIERMRGFEHRGFLDTDSIAATATFLLRREQGRLGGLAPVLRSIVAQNPGAALWGPGLAALYADLGMIDDARAELERLAVNDFAAVPHDGTREQCLAFLAEVAAAVGDRERSAWLFDEFLPAQGQLLVFWGNDNCIGPADRLLGMLASTAGRIDEADEWFQRATTFSRRLPSPLWVAHCLYDHAQHRRRTGGTGADEMLAEAAELCQKHDLAGLGARVEAERQLGFVARGRPTARSRALEVRSTDD